MKRKTWNVRRETGRETGSPLKIGVGGVVVGDDAVGVWLC